MNSKHFRFFSLMGVFLSFSVFSADIVPQKGVSLMLVNGQEADGKQKPNRILDGINQVVVQFDGIVGNSSKGEVFTSGPYIITFKAKNEDVQIKAPKVYSVMHAKGVFKDSPEWVLKSNGEVIPARIGKLEGRDGFLPFYEIEEIVQDYNKANNIDISVVAPVAVVAATEPVIPAKNTVHEQKTDKLPKAHPQALEQMQAWYLKASKQERKAFRKWMVDQD